MVDSLTAGLAAGIGMLVFCVFLYLSTLLVNYASVGSIGFTILYCCSILGGLIAAEIVVGIARQGASKNL